MLKRSLSISFIILAFALMTPLLSAAQQGSVAPIAAGSEVVKGEVIVKFKPGVSDAQKTEVATSESAVIEKSLQEPDSKVMKIDETTDTVKAVNDLNNRPEVEYAEQNGVVKAEMVPNDPLNRYQWNFNAINMPSAWDMADGQGAIVAVIDTGVSYENYGAFHMLTDLAGTSFTGGWNFVDNTPHANDDHGHGSHVAGTVAQSTNNNFGVSGIAYKSTIMPVKVLNSSGSGTTAAVADGIRWAADHGAKVINLSLGSSLPSQTMENAVNYARNTKNVVVVAAAGNGARSGLIYPAAYESVISVAATDFNNNLTWYSQYGPGLDISAPGGDTRVDRNSDGQPDGILQQTIGSGNPATEAFSQYQGTSMATPHVSGVAALLVAEGVTSATQIQQILSSTAKDLGPAGYDTTYGNGLLDAAAAVQTQGLTAPKITYPAGGESLIPESNIRVIWDRRGPTDLTYNIAYSTDPAGAQWTEIATATQPGATFYDWRLPNVDTANFKIRVRAVSGSETSAWSTSGFFSVIRPLALDWWNSGAGNWDWSAGKAVVGDFNGDSKDDIGILYGYGGSRSRLWVMASNGTSFDQPQVWWDSGPGNWEWSSSKPVAGDFNGDGKDDIGILYGYGGSRSRLWMMTSNGSSLDPPHLGWDSGSGNWDWGASKIQTGDYSGDGKSDISILYGYHNEQQTRAWVFTSDGSDFNRKSIWWDSGPRNWSWDASKPTSADFNNDGKDDLAILYGYRTERISRAWVLNSNGSNFNTPLTWWDSGPGNWDWEGSKLVSGDVGGDGRDDIAIFYGYSGSHSRFWELSSNITSFNSPSTLWDSGAGRWDWQRSEPLVGDFNGDGTGETIILYGYGGAQSKMMLLNY